MGERCLPFNRWRNDLAERRVGYESLNWADDGSSQKSGNCLRRGAWQSLGGRRRARSFQDNGWGKIVEIGVGCTRSPQRRYGCLRSRHGTGQSGDHLRRNVRPSAETLEFHLWRLRDRWRRCGGHFQKYKWRRHMEKMHGRSTDVDW